MKTAATAAGGSVVEGVHTPLKELAFPKHVLLN